jgi:hypothetical protein
MSSWAPQSDSFLSDEGRHIRHDDAVADSESSHDLSARRGCPAQLNVDPLRNTRIRSHAEKPHSAACSAIRRTTEMRHARQVFQDDDALNASVRSSTLRDWSIEGHLDHDGSVPEDRVNVVDMPDNHSIVRVDIGPLSNHDILRGGLRNPELRFEVARADDARDLGAGVDPSPEFELRRPQGLKGAVLASQDMQRRLAPALFGLDLPETFDLLRRERELLRLAPLHGVEASLFQL